LEAVTVVAIVLILVLPIQDYALREYEQWQSNPSSETWKAFLDKRGQESRLRITIASPFIAIAVLLAFPLVRSRPRSSNGQL
jgi:hypothetical protein